MRRPAPVASCDIIMPIGKLKAALINQRFQPPGREVAKFVMPKIVFALFFAALLLHAGRISAETFNEKFCREEHPNGDACLKWAEEEDHKALILGANTPGVGRKHTGELIVPIPYDPADEERKLKLRRPVPGAIIMDSPAAEISINKNGSQICASCCRAIGHAWN